MNRVKIIIAAAACFAASLGCGAYVKSMYVRDASEYASLREAYTSDKGDTDGKTKKLEEGGQMAAEKAAEDAKASDAYSKSLWMQNIDFKGLNHINEDVAAWIALPGTAVSYPVMYSRERTFYLHRNMYRQYSYSGSIFIDSENSPDFSDPNIILYGHNMRDGSMFAGLNDIYEGENPDASGYILAAVPGKIFVYRIFSIHRAVPEGDTYRVGFKNDEAFRKWKRQMEEMNEVRLPGEDGGLSALDDETRVITLSTCAEDNPDERLVVQGLLVKEQEA